MTQVGVDHPPRLGGGMEGLNWGVEGWALSPSVGVAAGFGTWVPSPVASPSLSTAAGTFPSAGVEGTVAAVVVLDTLTF